MALLLCVVIMDILLLLLIGLLLGDFTLECLHLRTFDHDTRLCSSPSKAISVDMTGVARGSAPKHTVASAEVECVCSIKGDKGSASFDVHVDLLSLIHTYKYVTLQVPYHALRVTASQLRCELTFAGICAVPVRQ